MKLAPRCREVPDGKLAVYNAGTLRAVGHHKSDRKESAEMLRKKPLATMTAAPLTIRSTSRAHRFTRNAAETS
jgi:hypothetical protein